MLTNAGGVNPELGAAARALIAEQGLDLKVAVVLGDDLLAQGAELGAVGYSDMFSGEAFPEVEKLASVNAYLGGFPVAEALDAGADIVITGRSVDSAVTWVRVFMPLAGHRRITTSWPAGRWPVILLNAGRKPQAAISQIGIWSKIRLPILAIRLPKYGQMAISPAPSRKVRVVL